MVGRDGSCDRFVCTFVQSVSLNPPNKFCSVGLESWLIESSAIVERIDGARAFDRSPLVELNEILLSLLSVRLEVRVYPCVHEKATPC